MSDKIKTITFSTGKSYFPALSDETIRQIEMTEHEKLELPKHRLGVEFVGMLPEEYQDLKGISIATMGGEEIIIAHPKRMPQILDIKTKKWRKIEWQKQT